MRLSAPTGLVFLIALVVAIVGVLEAMGTISVIPLASVWIMAIAYAVLAVGCIIKGFGSSRRAVWQAHEDRESDDA